MPKTSQFDEHIEGDFGDMDFEEIKTATSVLSNIYLVRGTHEETIPSFAARPLAFIFLDSDLYDSHMIAMKYLWPMLSINGVMMLHDWNTADCPGVKKAVADFFGDRVINSAIISDMLAIQK
jgi:hypothetical protein